MTHNIQPQDGNKFSAVSASEPDWSREAITSWWQPSKQLLRTIRRYQYWRSRTGGMSLVFSKWYVMWHRFWSAICSCDIPINAQIQGGLVIPHPVGIVIHHRAKIGPNCLILQQVTLVADVELEGNVDIGAGAKIIEPVSIGAHAKIGANAVLLQSVPPNATAVGIPAKIIHR